MVERLSYDPWGKRRTAQPPASAWAGLTPGSYLLPASLNNWRRGYTGHEHLDGLGLIRSQRPRSVNALPTRPGCY